MVKLIEKVTSAVPAAPSETKTLGRTLKKRASDGLAYFDQPGTSSGSTEAITAAAAAAAAGRLASLTLPRSSVAPLRLDGFACLLPRRRRGPPEDR